MGSPKPTPRQEEVLELASIGLSDTEIAARLNVSPRTIRFQLEKIFLLFGVRSRSGATAAWMESKIQARRPVDECPYPKPFPDHFAECPAYEAGLVADLDQRYQPVGRIWGCLHLQGRLRATTEHRWYGACVLGDTAVRQRWAEQAGPDRLRAINQLLHEMARISGPFAQRLWELKGHQARALERKQDPTPATQSMGTLAGRFMADLETFLNRRRTLLVRHQLAITECLELARWLIDKVVEQGSPAVWDERFDTLVRFPADVWSAAPSNSPESATHAMPHRFSTRR
jgi:DNA-binding CsgD family transcriptional regulator